MIGGEEMHNNHHAFPSSAKFSNKWWEFDIGWLYIRLMSLGGLARVKRVAPAPVILPGEHDVDMDTLRAVIINRLHVLASYGREVMLPVLREEVRRGDSSCRNALLQARGLLVREFSLLDERARRKLDNVLSSSQALKTVYQYRQRLQEVWGRSASSQENLLRDFRTGAHRPRRPVSRPCGSSAVRCADIDWPLPERRDRDTGTGKKPRICGAFSSGNRSDDYLIFPSLYITCFRTTGSNFFISNLSGMVPLVLGRRVEVPGAGTGNQLDLVTHDGRSLNLFTAERADRRARNRSPACR